MSMKLIMWIWTAVMIVSLASTLYFDIFDIYAFYGVFVIGAGYIAGYIYLKIMFGRDQSKLEMVKTLDYCWMKASQILQRMPGGTSIEWRKGEGRRGEIRYFYDNNKKHAFRALYGYTSETRKPVVVIFDMEIDDVARYYSNPGPQVLEDPFHDFKPFFNPMAEQMMRSQMMMRRGKKGRRGGGLTINYGGGDASYLEPGDDYADAVVGDNDNEGK